jgi:exonuclease SbcD
VLVTHQFVTGAKTCGSEEISVGGTDNIEVSVFDGFDYVALGHIHSPQRITKDTVRYAGSPLKYSFSEVRDQKSVTVVTLGEKGELDIRTVPLPPLRDMQCLRGTYASLMERSFYEKTPYREDYLRITLTDEEDVPEAAARLRTVYRNLMKLDYDNSRTRAGQFIADTAEIERKSPMELYSELFEMQNGRSMSETQREYMENLMEDIWEGTK